MIAKPIIYRMNKNVFLIFSSILLWSYQNLSSTAGMNGASECQPLWDKVKANPLNAKMIIDFLYYCNNSYGNANIESDVKKVVHANSAAICQIFDQVIITNLFHNFDLANNTLSFKPTFTQRIGHIYVGIYNIIKAITNPNDKAFMQWVLDFYQNKPNGNLSLRPLLDNTLVRMWNQASTDQNKTDILIFLFVLINRDTMFYTKFIGDLKKDVPTFEKTFIEVLTKAIPPANQDLPAGERAIVGNATKYLARDLDSKTLKELSERYNNKGQTNAEIAAEKAKVEQERLVQANAVAAPIAVNDKTKTRRSSERRIN